MHGEDEKVRGWEVKCNNARKGCRFPRLHPKAPLSGLTEPDIFHGWDINSFNRQHSPFFQTCTFTGKFVCVVCEWEKQEREGEGVFLGDETHMQSLDFSTHINHSSTTNACALTATKSSCPNRQSASSVKWQTGCWEHFHQSEALILLPSLLFIFCYASSLSRAFEIFPLWCDRVCHPS